MQKSTVYEDAANHWSPYSTYTCKLQFQSQTENHEGDAPQIDYKTNADIPKGLTCFTTMKNQNSQFTSSIPKINQHGKHHHKGLKRLHSM